MYSKKIYPDKKDKVGKKKVPKEKSQPLKGFSLSSNTYFLTYKGFSEKQGRNISKQELLDHLLHDCVTNRKMSVRKYLVCEEMYDSGQPHFHVILVFPRRKRVVQATAFDYLDIHPNIQTMRNMKAALGYVYKEDPRPLTNMDVLQQRRVARAKDTSSLYELLEQEMLKDPFNFDVYAYLQAHDLFRQVYKANFSKALTLIKHAREATCNRLLIDKPGFKFIDRALIESQLTPSELQLFDSWEGYQTIVDHLNQIPRYRFRRPAKTMNLLLTGPKSIGKSALVWQQYLEPHLNPINRHCSVYPMGLKDWFPEYKSQVYDLIYWNEAKLTSYAYDVILQLLDGSPTLLPAKGSSHKKVDNPLVIMTSNMTLEEMIREKFRYNLSYRRMARQNLSVRITNVVVPQGLDLFLLQKLLVPSR